MVAVEREFIQFVRSTFFCKEAAWRVAKQLKNSRFNEVQRRHRSRSDLMNGARPFTDGTKINKRDHASHVCDE